MEDGAGRGHGIIAKSRCAMRCATAESASRQVLGAQHDPAAALDLLHAKARRDACRERWDVRNDADAPAVLLHSLETVGDDIEHIGVKRTKPFIDEHALKA